MVLAGVAVVDGGGERRFKTVQHLLQFVPLVLFERLEREYVEGVTVRILQQRGDDRGVVDQGFAAGGRGGDDDVLPVEDLLDAFGLVAVEPVDAGGGDHPSQFAGEVIEVLYEALGMWINGLLVDDGVSENAVFQVGQVPGYGWAFRLIV